MQVLCKISNEGAEVNCSVCGQGFALVWERPTKLERAKALHEIDKTLRKHHYNKPGPEAHPVRGFLVPELDSSMASSGAAITGHAPSWSL
jgi:hypothetical protein